MKDLAVYFDADGVLADYDAGIRARGFDINPRYKNDLNRSGTKNPLKRKMYDAIRGTDFYFRLPIMPGSTELYREFAAAEPIILTAAPKFGATDDGNYHVNPHWLGAAYHKRRWFEERFLPAVYHDQCPPMPQGTSFDRDGYIRRVPLRDEHFICTTSSLKQEFMGRKKARHQVLVDDRIDNCRAWAAAGGVAIFHSDPLVSARHLREVSNEALSIGPLILNEAAVPVSSAEAA